MNTKTPSGPRVAALVGPYTSGKTSLLESILAHAETIARKGTVKEGNMIGDANREASARQMSTEINIATCEYLGESWTFLDCPGSVELSQDRLNATLIADTTVVVCEADPDKAVTVAPILNYLEAHNIPHILFVNKMDASEGSVRATLEALQDISERPLVLREIPIRDGDGISGHIDLVSERAFEWQEGASHSKLMELPDVAKDDEELARTELLESLADFDDDLLENLLEDVIPSTDEIYATLTKDLRNDLIVPVFFGSAEQDSGVTRLMKALRHESPEVGGVVDRLGLEASGAIAQVFKTVHLEHVGKLSYARVLSGEIKDGMTLNGDRVSGINKALGQKLDKVGSATAGEIVSLGRMDDILTGATLTEDGRADADWPAPLSPLFALTIHAEKQGDDVKLSGALAKLVEEDPSLSFGPDIDTGEFLLWGQGEMHLMIAVDKLRNRFNLGLLSERPQVPYKETIRKPVTQHARHKKQSGGHGEFGDVHLDIKPLPRGSGFQFDDSITGGVVPKQYIPAVEHGVKEFMARGPLGFPVVDVSVTLTDGQFHAVDSSDMAFKKAAQQAMREGLPSCNPVLLEPIFDVTIALPNSFTSGIQRLVSGRRGQILGFDAKDGWQGWDEIKVQLPQSEMHDLIIELRSMTQGVGTYEWAFDHLQEFSGKDADKVIQARNGSE
ncbi:MAG: elongation factor G [Rhodospirillaceae bacterium]|nr:elongation factor G [Rhodospirillaceae bacterium]